MNAYGGYALSEPLMQGIRLVTFTSEEGESFVIGHAMRSDDAALIQSRAASFHQAKVRNGAARDAARERISDLMAEVHGTEVVDGLNEHDAADAALDLTHKVAEALTREGDAFRATATVAHMAGVPGSMDLLRRIEGLLARVAVLETDPVSAAREAATMERMVLGRSPMIRNLVQEWREPSTLAMTA